MRSQKVHLGMDVHEDMGTLLPTLVKQLPNDRAKLRRFFDQLSRQGAVAVCYEASGAGYLLARSMFGWGCAATRWRRSLVPKRLGERHKNHCRHAIDLVGLYRAGELVTTRIPSEAEERVLDLVHCREAFQREILRSWHYLRTLLARRGFVYPKTNRAKGHLSWILRLLSDW